MKYFFPYHQKKAFEVLKQEMKDIDIVLEVVDARAPIATENRKLNEIVKDKKVIKIFNKVDISDEEKNKLWKEYMKRIGKEIYFFSSKLPSTIKELRNVLSTKYKRGLVVGIPNVGKSTIINSLAKEKKAHVGANPGITKGKQWLKISKEFYLIDTPGILPVVLTNERQYIHLAAVGCLQEGSYDEIKTATYLISFLKNNYSEKIKNFYKIDSENFSLEYFAKFRNYLLPKGKYDLFRAAKTIINDYARGKLAKITLEIPFEPE